MRKFKRFLFIWMSVLLALPLQALVFSSMASADQSDPASGYVRIKNKWQGNYLYEDSAGTVRYGYTGVTDPSSDWLVEDTPGNSGYKRLKNRQTGHYVTMAGIAQRRDALTAVAASVSTIDDQWIMEAASRPGAVTFRSAKFPNTNQFIHVEDQLGFAEVSADIGAAWESPQWVLEAASDLVPMRIVNKEKAGQALYEDKDGLVQFGKIPMDQADSHWYLDTVSDNPDGSQTVKLRNRATGHFITQGTFWDKIKSVPLDATTKNQWNLTHVGNTRWITFTNVYALGTDRSANDGDDIEPGSQTYVLNTQFPDTFGRSNAWSNPGNANAQWELLPAADVKSVRIANYTSGQTSDKYLYEDNGIVKYGALSDQTVNDAVYQWIAEDYNGNKRIRNLATGNAVTLPQGGQGPLQTTVVSQVYGGSDQWVFAPSAQYDDYQTVQSAVYGTSYMTTMGASGTAEAAADNPDADTAQWLFEDTAAVPGAIEYVQIQSEWQSMVLYEDAQGSLKYGNALPGDPKAQWLIEKFAGRKRIKNRATGHYVNIQDMSTGHIRVTPIDDSWTSAIWKIETLGNGTKLIHSVNDSNADPVHQKFIHLQNLNKYAEYSEINRNWGSSHWKFVKATDGIHNFTIKNKGTGTYFFEEKNANDDNGKVKFGNPDLTDPKSQWYTEDAGGGTMFIRNRGTGHSIAMEGIDPVSDTQSDPVPSMVVDPAWASPKWFIEDAPASGFKVFRSGWTGEHYLNQKDNTGYAQANKAVSALDSAQYLIEDAPAIPVSIPEGYVRIKNDTNGSYLFENNRGIVKYGTPAENDGYSHWDVETANGVQRLKNRATGHYMTINEEYSYIESTAVPAENQKSHWIVESAADSVHFLIRSNDGNFNDEYLNVQNAAGYPERGLFPNHYGTLQWKLEPAPQDAVNTPVTETRNLRTATDPLDDTNYIRFVNKSTGRTMLDHSGLAAGENESENPQAVWLLQDFNGRKLIKNRATGLLLAADGHGTVLRGSDPKDPRSQWTVEDVLGYKRIVNAADPQQALLESPTGIAVGVPGDDPSDSLWTLEPIARDVAYEAETAFLGGGTAVSSDSSAFTGTGYVDHFTAQGAKAIIAVNAQAAGTYQATVSYRNTAVSAKTLSLYVNGIKIQTLAFANSNSWSGLDAALPLREGYNSVSLEFDGTDTGDVAIDSLTVHNDVNKPYRGAIETYTTYEAEQAATNGTVIGPTRVYHEIASEASGRKAVKLDQTGQHIQFTLAKPANSIVLRYAMPDSANGQGLEATLGLYVNDVKVKDLHLTSKYAWEYGNYPWSNDPKQGSPHRFFDEVHALIGDVPAGAVIKLQKDAGDTSPYYIIDFADMERAPVTAYEKPDGYVSVTDFGAAANDGQDDSQAFIDAMTAARSQHKGVWFPAGEFELAHGGNVFGLDDITIRGAGMWHTTLKGAKFFGNGSNIRAYDFAIDGELNIRDDVAHTNGFEGAFGPGSTVQSVWIEHTKTGMWIARPQANSGFDPDKYTNEFYVGGLRLRNLMADGMNFSTNTKNSMVEQTDVRYPGDDGLAMWSTLNPGYSDDYTDNNTFRFDTVRLPWLADNMVVFGGKDNKMLDNVLTDTIGLGGGIAVSTRFNPTPFEGTTRVERNTLIRTGSRDAGLNLNFGAIWVYANDKPIGSPVMIRDNVALDSTYQGISIQGDKSLSGVTFNNTVIDKTGTTGMEIAGTVSGSLTVDNVIIRNARLDDVANNAGAKMTITEQNEGFASTKNVQEPEPNPDPGPSPNPGPGTGTGTGGGQNERPEKIKLGDDILKDAIGKKEQMIVFETKSDKSTVEVEISAGALLDAAAHIPGAVIVIKHGNVTYEFPVDLNKLIAENPSLQSNLAKGKIIVRIGKVDDAAAKDIKKKAENAGIRLLDTPIEFEIRIESEGGTITLKHFGKTYVTRSITLDGSLDAASTTALVYDPAADGFRFVPALFKTENGKTTVAIKSTGNSIYTVAAYRKTFEDIAAHWSKADVELLAAKTIVQGRTDTGFAPDQQLTRAEWTALIVRALGLVSAGTASAGFNDVQSGDWYAPVLQTAVQYGLIDGFDDGTFRPGEAVTREQMAVMLARALKFLPTTGKSAPGAAALESFRDAGNVDDWAKDAFSQLVDSGILTGDSDARLNPRQDATRAESAAVILRLLKAGNLLNP